MRWIGWMAPLWLCTIACGDDDATPIDTDGSTGASTGVDATASTQSPPGTSTDIDDTGSVSTSSGDDTSGSDSGTTTGGQSTGRASLILRADLDTPGVDQLYRIDYVEGVLTDPLEISGPPGEGIGLTPFSDSGTKLFYRAIDSPPPPYMYIPIDGGEAGSVSPVSQAPAPEAGAFSQPVLFADETRVAYWAAEDTAGTNQAIYLADIDSVAVSPPVVAVATPPAGEHLDTDVVVSASNEWMSYSHSTEGGAANTWILPISPLESGAAVQVSDLDQATQRVTGPAVFVPGDQAVWYRADRDIDLVNEIFFVDISGPTPAAPVKVNDPLSPEQYLNPARISPDRTRLAYFVGQDLLGDVYVVTFDGNTVSAPLDVSTLGDGEAAPSRLDWSPDGNWLTYVAEHEQAGAQDLYLVDMSGAEPSEPMLVTQPGVVVEGGIAAVVFDPTADWLYIIASIENEAPELYRCELSSGSPGELQKVSGELVDGGWLPGTIVLSHDSSRVLYHAFEDDPDALELYMVDISGAEPGPATKLNAPLAAGENVSFSVDWSWDDSAILYLTNTAAETRPLWIVGVDAPGEATLVADNAASAIVLPIVPGR
jgi:hypothetical protein